jgi:hypothetical protein
MKYRSYILLASIACILFACAGPNKINSTKRQIAAKDSELVAYGKTLDNLSKELAKKQERNEVDDTSTKKIQEFIDKTNSEIAIIHKKNSVLVGETEVSKADWNELKKSLMFSNKVYNTLTNKVDLIADLIAHNTVVRIDQDVIFGPGKYTVDSSVAISIGTFFKPAVAEIEQFIKKYPDFPLSLVITAKGYADGTTISETSVLYKELKERLKLETNSPDAKQLNKELSNARAESVIKLFKTFSIDRSGKNDNIGHLLYLYEGKGETFPNPLVTDYKTDDPRRRVVLLFWSIFPD